MHHFFNGCYDSIYLKTKYKQMKNLNEYFERLKKENKQKAIEEAKLKQIYERILNELESEKLRLDSINPNIEMDKFAVLFPGLYLSDN